jgi:Sensors of blue-light using FAD
VKRLRYISRFAHPMQRDDIEELARKAQEHNEREHITGILVAEGNLFFQLIEGPDAKIDALFERIAADPRHSEMMVLSTEQGDFGRICPDWAMRKVDLGMESRERAAPVRTLLHLAYSQQKLVNEAVGALESFTWRGFIDAEMEALESEL